MLVGGTSVQRLLRLYSYNRNDKPHFAAATIHVHSEDL